MPDAPIRPDFIAEIVSQWQIKVICVDVDLDEYIGALRLFGGVAGIEHLDEARMLDKIPGIDKTAILVNHDDRRFRRSMMGEVHRDNTDKIIRDTVTMPLIILRFFIRQVHPTNPSQFLRFF